MSSVVELKANKYPNTERFIKITCDLIGDNEPSDFLKPESGFHQSWDSDLKTLNDIENYLKANDLNMGHSEYCQIMIILGQQPVSQWFFVNVLGGPLKEISSYEKAVNHFRIIAARRFGNFKYAFKFFAGIRLPKAETNLGLDEDPAIVWDLMNRNSNEIEAEFQQRPKAPITISEIPKENRFFVSELNKPKEGDSEFALAEQVLKTAKRNTVGYLSSDYIDVYVATSMRTRRQFTQVAEMIESTFAYDELSKLNIRFFDPTSSEGRGDRISKSLIEALMLKRAKVALYLAQESDSLGKDSELSTMLVQGKDVIVYVPEINIDSRINDLKSLGESVASEELIYFKRIAIEALADRKRSEADKIFPASVMAWDKLTAEKIDKQLVQMEKSFYDKRATILKEGHPLGLQVNLSTGVANGVIVVRSPNEAAKMLRASLLNSHHYEIEEPTDKLPFWSLREHTTQSTVRVVSSDSFLTKAFWSNYIELAPLNPPDPNFNPKSQAKRA